MGKQSPDQVALSTLIEELKRQLLPVLSIPRRYLTEEEASRYLSISVHSLRQWRSRGEKSGPPYFKVNSSVRYDMESLDAWIEQFRVKQ